MKTVVFDLDGTLSDASWRQHLVEKRPKDYRKFFALAREDPVREEIAELCRVFHRDKWNILIFSGRLERHRKDTERWLQQHNIPWHGLYLRRNEDEFKKDADAKQEMLDALDCKVHLAIDDRDRSVAMWRRNGIVCLQCAPGKF